MIRTAATMTLQNARKGIDLVLPPGVASGGDGPVSLDILATEPQISDFAMHFMVTTYNLFIRKALVVDHLSFVETVRHNVPDVVTGE